MVSVTETPGVCGGFPCIENTRVPVRSVVIAYRELGDVDKTVEVFPRLTREQVRYTLGWYSKHLERVDEDIRRNARTLQALQTRV